MRWSFCAQHGYFAFPTCPPSHLCDVFFHLCQRTGQCCIARHFSLPAVPEGERAIVVQFKGLHYKGSADPGILQLPADQAIDR